MGEPGRKPKKEETGCIRLDKLAAHIVQEVAQEVEGLSKDVRYLAKFELAKLRPETQLTLANSLIGQFDHFAPSHLRGWSAQIGIIDLKNGGLKIKVWTKDVTDLSKESGVMLNFQLIDF